MKIFGIGLNKTGTTSLGKALITLGYKNHTGCNWELTKHWSENNLAPIFEQVEKHNNFEDWPWPLVYKDLYKKYDDAKFILTKRNSAEDWYNSLCRYTLKTGPTEFRKRIYGYYMPHDFKKEHIDFYNKHNEDVIQFFKNKAPEKLLVISLSDGNNWEKLCTFLDKDIPETDFPFLNTSKNHTQPLTIYNKQAIRLINTGLKVRKTFRSILK